MALGQSRGPTLVVVVEEEKKLSCFSRARALPGSSAFGTRGSTQAQSLGPVAGSYDFTHHFTKSFAMNISN